MMRHAEIAPAFTQTITFLDVDAAVIAEEDGAALNHAAPHNVIEASHGGAWDHYMKKILRPLPRPANRRPGLRLWEAGCC